MKGEALLHYPSLLSADPKQEDTCLSSPKWKVTTLEPQQEGGFSPCLATA